MQMYSLDIILPFFIIVILGYISRKSGYVKPELADHLTQFFLCIIVPTIIIAAIGGEPFHNLTALGPFFIALLAINVFMFFFAMLLAHIFSDMNLGERGFFGLACSMSNAGMLVIPLLYEFFGPKGTAYAVISLIVVVLVLVPLSLIFCGISKGQVLKVL
jgi:predicted permease